MTTDDERIAIANDILAKIGARIRISRVEEIDPRLFLLFMRTVCPVRDGEKLEIETSGCSRDGEAIVRAVLKRLEAAVLRGGESLGHISARAVARGDRDAQRHLLQIFQALLPPQRVPHSSRTRDTGTVTETDLGTTATETQREQYLRLKLTQLLSQRRRSETATQISPQTASRVGGADDDLTCVTVNEPPGGGSSAANEAEEASCVSNETYVLESTDRGTRSERPVGDLEEEQATLKEELALKDAWAKVNRDLVQKGYEREFLDMLLEEGDVLEHQRSQCDRKGQMLRQFSERGITTRPFSAFDDLLRREEREDGGDGGGSIGTGRSIGTRRHERRNKAGSSTRNAADRGGFMRPLVKQLNTQRSDRSNGETEAAVSAAATETDAGAAHGDQHMIARLLDSFPGLELSEHTFRQLWTQAAQQAATIQKAQREFASKLAPSEQRIEEARKRQELLTVLLRKEAEHQMRLQERHEERKAVMTTHATKEKQRQQSARARRYYEEFANGMRARMMAKQAREEQVFRKMFQAALKIQRDRINEMRRYSRDVKNEHLMFHQRDLDCLENYYRDRFAMLAESLRTERKQIELQDKSQELALLRLKKEMRAKLERDIRLLQDSLVDSQHELYFRELDAGQILSRMP